MSEFEFNFRLLPREDGLFVVTEAGCVWPWDPTMWPSKAAEEPSTARAVIDAAKSK